MERCVLLLVMIVGCRPAASQPTSTAASPEPAAVVPAAAPKVDVTVHNMGPRECNVAVWSGEGTPGPDVAAMRLPIRTTTIAMGKDEKLAVQNAEGVYGTMGSTQGGPGVIVVHSGCTAIAVADEFSPKQLATMAPHVMPVCCGACDERGCTACSEPKAGAACKGEQSIDGKCSLVDGVLDCVPATVVDADGVVAGEYAFARLSAGPAK